jgi:hypothetical protein
MLIGCKIFRIGASRVSFGGGIEFPFGITKREVLIPIRFFTNIGQARWLSISPLKTAG